MPKRELKTFTWSRRIKSSTADLVMKLAYKAGKSEAQWFEDMVHKAASRAKLT